MPSTVISDEGIVMCPVRFFGEPRKSAPMVWGNRVVPRVVKSRPLTGRDFVFFGGDVGVISIHFLLPSGEKVRLRVL